MRNFRSKTLIIGSGPATFGATMMLDHVHVVDAGGSLELEPANRAASTGVRNLKDTQRVCSNPQQSDPIQVGSDIQ